MIYRREKEKMKRSILYCFILIIVSNVYLFAQIHSTNGGGKWDQPATWVGGAVPSGTNDVVINGRVEVTANAACRNLTINAGAELMNDGSNRTLQVNGNIMNNGRILNNNWYLTINVSGSITNNGEWANHTTNLTGSTNRTISLTAGRKFESVFVKTESTGGITAATPLHFTKSFDLGTSTLNLQNNALTLEGAAANILNGQVSNTRDLILFNNARLSNIIYQGSIQLKRRVMIAAGVTFRGDVTVVDTLDNDGSNRTLEIEGSIVNNGLTRNNNWYLTVNINGAVTNNGVWMNHTTNLTGSSNQTLTLASGKKFESVFVKTESAGGITAATPLHFTRSFDLGTATLNLQDNALTLEGAAANIFNGQVLNTRDLILFSNARLSNVTYQGSIQLKRRVMIAAGVTFQGDVTVVDTLDNDGSNRTLVIEGSIVNNGLIRNNNWYLTLNINGAVTNNGLWLNHTTNLTGSSNQILTLAEGMKLESVFVKSDSSGGVTAATPLHFTKSFDLGKSVLNLQGNPLTLEGAAANISNGRVSNTSDLILFNNARLSNIIYQGSIQLKRRVMIAAGVTFQGDVTVVDTLENDGSNRTLAIEGSIVNNGLIRNNNWYLTIDINGAVTNNGEWINRQVNLTGIGKRTVTGYGMTSFIHSTGGHVILDGENHVPNLTIPAGSRCVLASGGTLYVESGTITGRVENHGMIMMKNVTSTTRDYNFFQATVRVIAGGGIDTLTVKSYGHQVPETFANAVRSWWEFETLPEHTTVSLPYATFHYTDDLLGSNVENQIELYYSDNDGETWRQLSTSLNTTRNADQNWIRVNDVPSNGRFLLSSSADPVSVMPSVILSVIGRNDIRVGPPSRYSIHYVNNSDIPTDDFLMVVNTQEGVHVERVEPSSSPGVQPESIPIDSLTYDDEDTEVYLWISGMAPREERLFDVVLRAYPDGFVPKLSDADSPQAVEAIPLILVAKVVGYVGVGLVVDYMTDSATNATEEVWAADANCETVWENMNQAIHDGVEKTNEKWKGGEKPAKEIAKMAAENLIERTAGVVFWPVKLGKFILDGTGAAFRGAYRNVHGRDPAPPTWQQKMGTQDTDIESLSRCPVIAAYESISYWNQDTEILVTDCNGNVRRFVGGASENIKTLRKVMSWDPNEKVAPAGYGPEGFITSAGRMNYQILFENLPAATAPAWRVIIVDTLSDVFDWETVEFGKTSHEGEEYVWKMTRDGNILRWEIEDIELVPNVNPPEGEGYVTFSVMAKEGLPSGTKLRNRAEIIFDFNPPIITDEVVNTLDFKPPVTTIHELPPEGLGPEIVVRWTSDDGADGSGVESTVLYVSKDGGGFFPVGSTGADSLLVPVDVGSRYAFYALSRDRVGNVETIRPLATETLITGTTGGIDYGPDVPAVFSLHQNYPNPFNPRTMIEFALPQDGYTTLKIYNMLGHEIATLLSEDMKSGHYKFEWNAAGVASGVYIYRLIQGHNMLVRRMIYVK